jgi:hypothetical protein
MEVGLFGIYSEGGVTQLKWGFQYANEDSNWKITRPGSSSATTNGKRLATYKDAVYKAKPTGESMQYYSSALVEDIKKCLEFDIKVKYILDDFGYKNTIDDYIGVASTNQYAFNNWETSSTGHEGRRYVGDADNLIGLNSTLAAGGKAFPVWKLDFVSLTNSFNLAKNDAINNGETNTTTSGAKPSFIGVTISTDFDMYMSFERSNDSASNIPSYMLIDVDAKHYKIEPTTGGYIRFKSPSGATYKLTGEKLLSQVTKPIGIDIYDEFGMGFTEGLQDLSTNFASATSAVGNVSFLYSFSKSVDWADAPSLTATPVSATLTVPNNTEATAEIISTSETASTPCRSSAEYNAQIGSIHINGSSRDKFSGGGRLTVTSSSFPITSTVFRTMSETISTFLSDHVKGYVDGALPGEGDAFYRTDYKLEIAYDTPWERELTDSHYYKAICTPSEE